MTATILEILVGLFAGMNILQFVFWRKTKRKLEAETAMSEIEAQQAKTDLQQDQFDYVNDQLSKIQQEYYDLAAKYRETMTLHLSEIDEKCNEIAGLKSKLTYFKGLRCYRSECTQRIRTSPYKKDDTSPSIQRLEDET